MSKVALAVAAALLVAGVSVQAACENVPTDGSCAWSCDGATYDMSVFEERTGHEVQDSRRNIASNNYSYVFNVCGNLAKAPNSHSDSPSGFFGNNCNVTHGSDGVSTYAPSPAFQRSNIWGFCYRLGGDYSESTWSLVDENNPSRGVVLTYEGGDSCDADGLVKRGLKLGFYCDPDPLNPFRVEGEPVEEVGQCVYEIFTFSHFGCPQECPIINNQLCNGKGVCDYDTDAKVAKCFCQDGFEGEGCATATVAPKKGIGAIGGVLIFVCLLLVALLVVLVYLWNKIRTLRLDPKAYSQLRGGMAEDEGTEDI